MNDTNATSPGSGVQKFTTPITPESILTLVGHFESVVLTYIENEMWLLHKAQKDVTREMVASLVKEKKLVIVKRGKAPDQVEYYELPHDTQ